MGFAGIEWSWDTHAKKKHLIDIFLIVKPGGRFFSPLKTLTIALLSLLSPKKKDANSEPQPSQFLDCLSSAKIVPGRLFIIVLFFSLQRGFSEGRYDIG